MSTSSISLSRTSEHGRTGIFAGVAAYLIWGMLPLYFRLIEHVGALEVVANRIIWSVLLLFFILAVRGTLRDIISLLRTWRVALTLTATAALIGVNWLVYVWAVNHGHVVAASLGYFLNPLVNVLLGCMILKERLGRFQWLAVGLAATGVAILATSALNTLWISLALALSFSFYGLIRKLADVAALEGLAAETLILSPVALIYLGWLTAHGTLALGSDVPTDALLVFTAVLTSVPLVLFAVAAKRMAYSTLGLLQYIGPTLQFLLGVLVFGESLSTGQLWSFGLIWMGLILYSAVSLRQAQVNRRAVPAME